MQVTLVSTDMSSIYRQMPSLPPHRSELHYTASLRLHGLPRGHNPGHTPLSSNWGQQHARPQDSKVRCRKLLRTLRTLHARSTQAAADSSVLHCLAIRSVCVNPTLNTAWVRAIGTRCHKTNSTPWNTITPQPYTTNTPEREGTRVSHLTIKDEPRAFCDNMLFRRESRYTSRSVHAIAPIFSLGISHP